MRCPDCGSTDIAQLAYERMCKCCGLVLDDSPIDSSTYTQNTQGHGTAPVNGSIVKDSWLYSSKEKNIKAAKIKIEELSSKIGLPEYITREAKSLFHNAAMKELNKGRDNKSFVAGSIYTACLIHGLPKTTRELSTHTGLAERKILKAYKLIKLKLGIKTTTVNPIDLVPKYGSRAGLKPKTITKAIELIRQTQTTNALAGKKPLTIVAAALYTAARINHENVTQRTIANSTGVIEITIRKRSKEIMAELN